MSLGALLLAVHVLGAMVWVGGMVFGLLVLRPGMAFLEPPLRLALHKQVSARFVHLLWYVMPAMLLTGMALQYLFYGGILPSPWPVQLMTATGLAMAAVFIAMVRGPWRDLRRALAANRTMEAGEAVQRLRRLTMVNLGIGLLTTIVAMLDY